MVTRKRQKTEGEQKEAAHFNTAPCDETFN